MRSTEAVWNEYHESLRNFIRSRVRHAQDAEDLLQEIFLRVHRSIGALSGEEKLQGWLYRIARNAITDYYRKNARKGAMEMPGDPLFELLESSGSEDASLNETVSRWLRCLIRELDDTYREALTLTELERLPQKELAHRLGLSISGAKSRVQRGREKLKEKLLACCDIVMDRVGNVIDYERKSTSCGCGC
ncbi:RNA polymerase sigma factor SigZ [Paenibacillus sp. TRM 82003]|nr:RNA polymerase sigma factor SigZ [Paenibacillus sp. TRM 82003]